MTEGAVRTFLRGLINESDTVRVTDATLDIHLTSACEAFNRRVGYRIKLDGSITITATTDFAVPTDLVEALVVEWNTFPLQPGSWREWRKKAGADWRSKTGTPEEYELIGRRIRLFPAPDAQAVADDNSLLVQYIQAAGAFDDTELAFISDQDHRILAYYAAAEWVENPANNYNGQAYAMSLYTKFETETKEVVNQYGRRLLSP